MPVLEEENKKHTFNTYVDDSTILPCIEMESSINIGAQSAKAPVVNATQVNPNEDSIKLLLKKSNVT